MLCMPLWQRRQWLVVVVDCLVVFMPGSSDLHFVVHPFGAVGDLLVCICRRLASDIESTAQIEAGQLGWPQMLCLLHAQAFPVSKFLWSRRRGACHWTEVGKPLA